MTFSEVPTSLVVADDHCKTELKVPAKLCSWFTIVGSDGTRYNATASPTADGKRLLLSANVSTGVHAVATSFGWSSWPINTVMSAEGLPLQPWPVTSVDL